MKIKGDTIVCNIQHINFCFVCGKHIATGNTSEECEKATTDNGGAIRKDGFYRAYCKEHIA